MTWLGVCSRESMFIGALHHAARRRASPRGERALATTLPAQQLRVLQPVLVGVIREHHRATAQRVDEWLGHRQAHRRAAQAATKPPLQLRDRKSTRLNSSHSQISYAVFCLKKKKNSIHNKHIPS